jgi:aldehyde:ferredoxin oxidoreductase
MRIMWVDMDKQVVSVAEEPESWRKWWGRGLIARILLDEMDATTEPLGSGNVLIFTRGPLAGTGISSTGRLSVGGKSPLTGGVKEANAGGNVGDYLGRLGIKAIVVKGKARATADAVTGPGGPAATEARISGDGPAACFVLDVSSSGEASLVECPKLLNLGCYEMARVLHEKHGEDAALILNGLAGTYRLGSAAVITTDREGVPTRAAARGGLGAVMASKGLKAVVLRRPDVPLGKCPAADEGKLNDARAQLNGFILANSEANPGMRTYGTAGMVTTMTNIGGLPTRNYSAGRFELADNIKGVTLHQVITERGGKTGHPCMAGCLVRCSNVFVDKEGNEVVRALEYETLAMMGSNLGVGDLDAIARFNWECNDLGVDTIETGAAIGVAMDAGLWRFGDIEGVMEALGHIRKGDVLGRVLGAGTAVTGKVLGWHRVPAVKGQSMAAYDPRAVKGIGVTYTTSPMGADHTAGHTVAAKVDHHAPEGQIDASRNAQVNRGAYDSLDICSFAMGGMSQHQGLLTEAISAVTGETVTPADIQPMGQECLLMEREFNRRAGFTPADDRMPDFMRKEKLPPYDVVFDVTDEDMSKVFDFEGQKKE